MACSSAVLKVFFWSLGAASLAGAARVTKDSVKESSVSESQGPPLCDDQIVKEATHAMNGDERHAKGDDWVSSDLIGKLLTATDSSVIAFWDAVGLSKKHPVAEGIGYWVLGKDLCMAVVTYVENVGVCPPSSDLACYNVDQETFCDLDVQPKKLMDLGPGPEQDLPDFHDKAIMDDVNVTTEGSLAKVDVSSGQRARIEEVDYSAWEASERVANFFRIYPTEKPVTASSLAEGATTLAGNTGMSYSQEVQHNQKLAQSKAYMSHVIRAFNARRTRSQITRWFGSSAYTSYSTRSEVLRVLNSIDHMIMNVQAVYEGPRCSSNTFAYVYPRAYRCSYSYELTDTPCTTYNGRFVIYLCGLYFRRPGEMVETLVHEGSHHATAYTDDVDFYGEKAYGRSTCQDLARVYPSKAVRNADNFCYYIQDVASEVARYY